MEKAWNIISRIYRIVRILSLDILAGVFCGYTFARMVLNCDCPALTPVFLCLTVWIIYTLDHLLDARTLKEESANPVYRWHYLNRKILWAILMGVIPATGFFCLVYLPSSILIFGGIMSVLVVFYTLVHQGIFGSGQTYIFKEVWISIIYTAGIWGVPLRFYGEIPDLSLLMTIIIYLILVLVNVLIYAYHDYYSDGREEQQTLATVYNKKFTSHILRLLILVVLILIMIAFMIQDNQSMLKAYLILLSMTAAYGLIIAFPRFFSKKERYGILADGVFLLPGLLFLIW